MKIALSQIHPSPNPIRKSWDEEKMKELTWSLMEEGQVEPIGVRENGAGYIVVWGHRRVEAARRATWKEIEASLVPANEIDNLIQAGIENLSSEDMIVDDKADWAQRLMNLGLTMREIERRSTIDHSLISRWLIYKNEKESGVGFEPQPDERDEGVQKIVFVARALGDDIKAKQSVLNKASNEHLNREQTQSVAEAYRDAPSPQMREAILKVDVQKNDTAQSIINKADVIVAAERSIPSLMQAIPVREGFDAVGKLGNSINYLKHVKQDLPTARLILKQWRGYLVIRLAEIDAILGPADD